MSNLSAFLHPTYTEETTEVVISDRFKDENGEPVKFKIKTLTQEQCNQIAKRSYVDVMINGKKQRELDRILYLNRCLVEAVVYPNFRDHDLCVAYGTEDPVLLPQKMLLTREYERLGNAFMKLNGLDEEDAAMDVITKN